MKLIEVMLFIQFGLQAVAAGVISGLLRVVGGRWPCVLSLTVIFWLIVARRVTAWAMTSGYASGVETIVSLRSDINVLNNIVIPSVISAFSVVAALEMWRTFVATKPGKLWHG